MCSHPQLNIPGGFQCISLHRRGTVNTHTHRQPQLTPLPQSVPWVPQLCWTLWYPMRLVDSLRKALHRLNVRLSNSQCHLKDNQVLQLCYKYQRVLVILALLTSLLLLFIKKSMPWHYSHLRLFLVFQFFAPATAFINWQVIFSPLFLKLVVSISSVFSLVKLKTYC